MNDLFSLENILAIAIGISSFTLFLIFYRRTFETRKPFREIILPIDVREDIHRIIFKVIKSFQVYIGIYGCIEEVANRSKQPPIKAEYLLHFLPTSKEKREAIIGDLEEEYLEMYQRYGEQPTVRWYKVQVVVTFLRFILLATEKLLKISWFASLLRLSWEYVKRFV